MSAPKRPLRSLLFKLALFGAIGAPLARGQLTNGSFETGDFTGWTTGGATVAIGQSGVYSSGGINWTIGPAGTNMAVLQPTGNLDWATTSAALHLSSDSITYFNGVFPDPTNFAYIYQSFHLNAGDTLTMGWNYLATDYAPFNDASFATFVNLDSPSSLGKINGGLAQINILGATVSGGNYNTGDYGSSGWETTTFQATVSGNYQLGAVIFNLSDTINSPYLFIDAVGGTTLKDGVPFNPVPPADNPPPPPTPVYKIDTTNGDISGSVFSLASNAATADPVQFAGGTLQMSGSTVLGTDVQIESTNAYVANNNGSGGFSGAVSGTGSLNISGGGSFSLSGNNSYSGGTNVTGTTVVAGSNSAFGSGSISLTNSTLSGAQSLSNTISLSGADTVNVASGTQTLSGVISGTGSLTKTGSGTSVLSGNNTYTGSTTVSAGTLTVNGTLASTSILVSAGGTLSTGSAERISNSANVTVAASGAFNLGGDETISQINGGGSVGLGSHQLTVSSGTFDGVMSGTGGLTKTNAGTLTLTGANTYTGATYVQGGTLQLDGSLASTTISISSGATLNNTASGFASNAAFTNAGTLNLSLDDTVASVVNSGTLNGPGKLTASTYALNNGSIVNGNLGAGVVTTNGSVALNGTSDANTVNIQTGTLTLGSAERLSDSADVTISSGANLSLGGDETISQLHGSGNVALNTNRLIVDSGSFSGVIAGSGGLTKNSVGTLTLLGSNTYTGATNVNAGTLAVNGAMASGSFAIANGGTLSTGSADLLSNSANVTVASGGAFNLGGDETIGQINGAGSVGLGSHQLTVSTGTFDGVMSGTGGVTKANAGTLTLTGANTYTGATNVQSGTVQLDGSLASTTVSISSGATLNNTNSGFASNAAFTNAGTLNLSLDDTVDSVINSGTLNGPGKLNANTYALNNGSVINGNLGGGVLTTNGNVTLNGTSDATTVNVQTGALTLGSAERLSDNADVTISSGANLSLGGDETVSQLHGAGSVDLNTNRLIVDSGSFSGVIAGSGGVTKNGAGTLTLSGANTYTGATNVNAGTLAVNGTMASGSFAIANGGTLSTGSADLLSNSANVTVASGGAFNLGGDETIGQINGAGSVGLGSHQLTVSTGTFDGVMSGTGGLTKANAGTLTLTGANTYTGATNVQSGTLQLDGSLASTAVSISSGATLNNTASGFASNAAFTNAGTLNLSLDDTVDSVINSGTLNGPGKLNANTYALNNGSVVNGNLGGGVLTTNGNVTLNGTSDATTVNVQTGTLTLGSAERLSDNADVTVSGGADLNLTGDETISQLHGAGSVDLNTNRLIVGSGNFSGVIAGTGGLTKNGAGTLTLSGANTYTGSTDVQNGTMDLDGSLASGSISIGAGGTLNDNNSGLSSASTVTNAGTLNLGSDETISTLTNSGTIGGAATLTASTYGLNNGSVVNANLGAGTLNSNGAVALNGTSAAGTVNVQTGTLTLGAADRLDDNANVTVSSGSQLALGGNETIGQLNGNGGVGLGSSTLSLGSGNFGGDLSGAGGVTKTGAGTLTLSGANSYTGNTTVQNGTLQLNGSLASGNVAVSSGATLNNANGGFVGNATLNNAGTVNLGADDTITAFVNSGTINGPGKLNATTYALNNGSVVNANLGGGTLTSNGNVLLNGTSDASTVTVQSGNLTTGSAERFADTANVTVNGSAGLHLGGDETIGQVNGAGNVILDTHHFTVSSGNFSGVIAGTGGVTKTGNGTLTLSGANTYTGSTDVQNGTLALDGSLNSGAVNVSAGGTLNDNQGGLLSNVALTNAGTVVLNHDQTVGTFVNSGTVNGGSTLTTTNYVLNGGSVINANLGAGTLTSNGSVQLNGVSGAGTVNIQSGTLSTGSAERFSNAADVTVASGAGMSLGGDETIDQLHGSGSVNVNTHQLIVSTGNFGGVIGGSGGVTKVGSGALTLTGANTYLGSTTIQGGTFNLTGSLESQNVNVAQGSTLNSSNGGLSSTSTLNNAGTTNLGADDTVGSFVNSGVLNGPGKLNANTYALNDGSIINANLGGGALTSNGNVLLNGTSDASTVTVQSGTLNLGSAERLADGADVTVAGGSQLNLGGNEKIGTINGGGHVEISQYNLTVSGGNFGGVINGSGGLNKVDGGVLTLGGANTYTGPTNVQGGTLTLDGSLATGTVNVSSGSTFNDNHGGLIPTVALNNDGTVYLGANQTVGTFVNSGTLNGPATLTTTEYVLNQGSVINANLGGGTITSNGSVLLNGTSAANTVNIKSGTLTTGSAERFSDASNVTISSGAALALGGDETIDQLNGSGSVNLNTNKLIVSSGAFGGVIGGSGGLTKQGTGTLTLTGANTYTGPTQVKQGVLDLVGSLNSKTVSILAGATLNDKNGGFADDAVVNNAGTLSLGANDTIKQFVNSGTLNGTSTLTASTYALNNGSVINANLGTGTVTTNGNVLLNGTSGASTVLVQTGTLTLGGAQRLSNTADLTVAGGSTLKMNGNQTVGTFVTAGRLAGNAGDTLTASTYDLRDGAVIDGNLGHGKLTSNGQVLLNGTAAAEEIKVQTGSLVLGAPDRLGDYAWVDLNPTAHLVLANGSDTIRLLTGQGAVELRNGSILTVLEGNYAGNATSTGALLKDSTTSLVLSGENTYEKGTTVRQGDLTVAPAGSLTSNVQIESHGVLHVDGSIAGAVSVDKGGQLMGGGTIAQSTVNHGTTTPGSNAGPLVVRGNYAEFGTLNLALAQPSSVNAASARGPFVVGGAVQVNPGSTLQLSRSSATAFEPNRGQVINLLSAAQGIDGSFSTLDRSAFTTQVLFDYGTGAAIGTGLPEGASFSALGGSGKNSKALAGALFSGAVAKDSSGAMAFIDTRKKSGAMAVALLQQPELTSSLDALSPEPLAGLSDYTMYSLRNYSREANRNPAVAMGDGWSIAASYSSYRAGVRSSQDNGDYHFQTHGSSAAVTKRAGRHLEAGVFFASDRGSMNAATANYKAKGADAGVFGSIVVHDSRNTRIDAGMAYGHSKFNGSRRGLFGSSTGKTEATAYDYWMKAKTDVVKIRRVSIAAIAGFSYTEDQVDAFKESGSEDSFKVARQKNNRAASETGLETAVRLTQRLSVVLNTVYERSFTDGARDVNATMTLGDTPVSVTAPGFDRNAAKVGASIAYDLTPALTVSGYYDAVMMKKADRGESFGGRVQFRF